MNSLEGKITLITGAKGGLGTFVTESFLAAGSKVIGVSRSIQAADFSHSEFFAMPAELSSGDAARKLTEDVAGGSSRSPAGKQSNQPQWLARTVPQRLPWLR
jgi:NAD(P)-dependent dehydrogenase (short-subunit alcohol dehydrogenase family)